MTPYGYWDLVNITWTNVDLSSVRSSDILLRAISQKISQPSITVIGLKSTHLKFPKLTNHTFVDKNEGLVKLLCMIMFNSLGPSDAIWLLRSGQHYLNQCWLISEGNFTEDISAINHCNWLEKYLSKISLESPKPQWVNISKSRPKVITWPNADLLSIRPLGTNFSEMLIKFSYGKMNLKMLFAKCHPFC